MRNKTRFFIQDMKIRNKGITLISLTVTIIILIILAFTLAVNWHPYKNEKSKSTFLTDIEVLKEEVDQYYARYGELPIKNKYTDEEGLNNIQIDKNPNDGDDYYVIDISKLEADLDLRR